MPTSTPLNTRRLRHQMQRRVSNTGMVTKALKRRSNSAKQGSPKASPKLAETKAPKNLKKQRLLLNSDSSIEGGRTGNVVDKDGSTAAANIRPDEEGVLSDESEQGDDRDPPVDDHGEETTDAGREGNAPNNDQPVTDVDTDAELASEDDGERNENEDERMEIDEEILDGEAMNNIFETA